MKTNIFTYSAAHLMLLSTLTPSSIVAQDNTNVSDENSRIIITGSRIARTELEGSSSVITLTAEDIQAQGFSTVAEALRSLSQATGFVESEQAAATVQNAYAVNLRGFGPGRNLVLLNGQRISDYPMPFGGESNFVNLAQIPAGIIERIEIMTGGASSIYGSDAISGVINIITKTAVSDHQISLRAGTTTEGGGDTYRIQFSGGKNFAKTNMTYALEYFNTGLITGDDRDYLDSIDDIPAINANDGYGLGWLINTPFQDADGDGYPFVDPAGICEQFSSFNRVLFPAPGEPGQPLPYGGYYCDYDNIGENSLRNEREWLNAFFNVSHNLGEYREIYATIMLWDNTSESIPWERFYFFQTPQIDARRLFSINELGTRSEKFDESSFNISAGMRGTFGETNDYEINLSHSIAKFKNTGFAFKTNAVNQYFLSNDTVTDPYYPLNRENFDKPLTPEIYQTLSGEYYNDADSHSTTLQAILSGELYESATEPAGYALVVEYASQKYDIDPDPNLFSTGDDPFYFMGSTIGGGERDRYAVGFEVRSPLGEQVILTSALRYDKYDDETDVDDALTYNVGVEFRPSEMLLLRAKTATSFRAPDMHYVFAEQTELFGVSQDTYLCRLNGFGDDCPFRQSVDIISGGSKQLKEEEGKSNSVGLVLQPNENFSVSLDYYELELEDIVVSMNVEKLLSREADCLIGQKENGDSVDSSSAECTDALNRTIRTNDGFLTGVSLQPINNSFLEQNGVDANIRYTLPTADSGLWRAELSYSYILDYNIQEFSDDPVEDIRKQFEPYEKLRFSVLWAMASFDINLFVNRIGETALFDETGMIDPWTTYNLNLGYQIDAQSKLELIINNLTDEEAPVDTTSVVVPYFNAGVYNAFGREVFVEYKYRF
ncbi:TonB-dependent receptor plug domain-containing protein [Aliikangiella maris]|uniref:TonB-dependent receptor n=2 Tax=Aliikangiella maris TaxID=3162458 RepID=A0ABV2BWF6_9GAMM